MDRASVDFPKPKFHSKVISNMIPIRSQSGPQFDFKNVGNLDNSGNFGNFEIF